MIDPNTLEELKAQHDNPDLKPLSAGGYDVVVKPPTRQVWRKFRTLAADPVKRGDCVEQLFLDCVVYPDKKAVQAMLSKKPALAENFGDECAVLAGAKEEVEKND